MLEPLEKRPGGAEAWPCVDGEPRPAASGLLISGGDAAADAGNCAHGFEEVRRGDALEQARVDEGNAGVLERVVGLVHGDEHEAAGGFAREAATEACGLRPTRA
jgi:hypothetical protein